MRKIISAALLCIAIFAISFPAYAQQTKPAQRTLDAYAPFEDFIQITPSDSTEYDPPLRGCIIEVAGDLAMNPIKSAANITLTVLKGQLVPVIMNQVLATGTTATVSCGR